MAKAINPKAKIILKRNNGNTNLNHFSKDTLAKPSIAIKTPFVGIMRFEIPSPNMYARTAVWRDIPKISDIGVINGIETKA